MTASPADVLVAEDLAKSFRLPSVERRTVREHVFGLLRPRRFEELKVLEGVSFSLRRGESLGIMGRNGCGKSTLLKILAGVYEADRGEVSRLLPLTPILELGLGWNPELDAIDNVYLIGAVMGLSRREIAVALPEILRFAELERFARLKLLHFSSGMASRLAYAVAFRAVREVLLLDEIFAVGDAQFRARCEQRYRELAERGCSVVLVSHDPRVISTFCQRAILLERGRIVTAGHPDEVVRAYLALGGASA